MKTLQVKLPERSYNVDIGFNILKRQLPNVVLKKDTDLVVVVTNETLHSLYPNHVSGILEDSGIHVATAYSHFIFGLFLNKRPCQSGKFTQPS